MHDPPLRFPGMPAKRANFEQWTEERKAQLFATGCIDVPVPMEFLADAMSPTACMGHGGYVAAIFDQFLGMAQVLGKQPGMTGYLHVNYHNRTPLNTELKLEGKLVRTEGRKTIMWGEMFADGQMTASCEGLFIQPRGGMQAVKNLVEGGQGD